MLLRVRDRAALRAALDAYAVRERARWAVQGRAAEYEALLADGHDPQPLIRPLADGAISVFTGIRFRDADAGFHVRGWLKEIFGGDLVKFHDDPRGVFVFPDVCEPRATTYDGIVEEIGAGGHFIDPRPPTAEERALHAREQATFERPANEVLPFAFQLDEPLLGAGDEGELLGALRARLGAVGTDLDPTLLEALESELVDLHAEVERLAHVPPSGPGDDAGKDPRGRGRICAAVPGPVWEALKERSRGFDVDDFVELAGGGALIVTTRLGDEDEPFMAQNLAGIVEEAGLDRRAIGALPFFRESLVAEVRDAADVAAVAERLGERARCLPLDTFDEAFARERVRVKRWLAEPT